jgi:hypothetical protein
MTAQALNQAIYCLRLSRLYSRIAEIHTRHGALIDATVALQRSVRLTQAADAWKAVA